MNLLARRKEPIAEEQPQPATSRRSESAARAAQYVEELEEDVERLRGEASAWERACTLAEGERDKLVHDHNQLRNLCEQLKALYVRLDERLARQRRDLEQHRTELDDIARLIHDGASRAATDKYAPKQEDLRKLSAAIEVQAGSAIRGTNVQGCGQEPQDEPLPSVVARGPAVPV